MSIANTPSPAGRFSLKQKLARLAHPPGRVSTFVAIATFTLSIIGLTTPAGPFFLPGAPETYPLSHANGFLWLPDPSDANPLAYAMSSMAIYLGLGLWMPIFYGPMVVLFALFSPEGGLGELLRCIIFMLPSSLWSLLCLNWLIRLGAQLLRWRRQRREQHLTRPRFRFSRWLVAPVLALVLYGLWVTQLPMKAAFAMQKGALEQLADQVTVAPLDEGGLERPRFIAPASVTDAFLPPIDGGDCESMYDKKCVAKLEAESIVSLPIQTTWAHAGYVRDRSRQPNQIEAHFFSFEEYSNHHDQEIRYLGDGWYVFQNAFD